MPKPKRRRRTTAEIQMILSDLEDSSQSRRQFASRRNIPLSTLQAWIRKHRSTVTAGLPDVIPVGTFCESASPIEIEFVGGEVLRLGPGCSGEDLRTVLAELRRC